MYLEILRRHLPAFFVIILVILFGIIVYPMIPDQIPTHFDGKGNPNKYGEKGFFLLSFIIFMTIFFIIILAIDIVFVYDILPGSLMASVNWVFEGVMAVIYLSTVAVALDFIGNFLHGFAFGVGLLILIFTSLYLRAREVLDARVSGLFGSPYFEKVKFSRASWLIFSLAPYFPRYIIQTPSGIRVAGVLYDVNFGWDRIIDIKSASIFSGVSGFDLRLNSSLSGLVRIALRGKRTKIILSPKDREEFIKTAGRFLIDKVE